MNAELELKLTELRRQIDEINQTISADLLLRLKVAEEIQKIKTTLGLPLEDRSREETILLKVSQAASSKVEDSYLKSIFEEIFKATKNA